MLMIEILKKETQLMRMCDLRNVVERTANCKTNTVEHLAKRIYKLELLLDGEYEKLSLEGTTK